MLLSGRKMILNLHICKIFRNFAPEFAKSLVNIEIDCFKGVKTKKTSTRR